jgi:hypothetical protein
MRKINANVLRISCRDDAPCMPHLYMTLIRTKRERERERECLEAYQHYHFVSCEIRNRVPVFAKAA